MDVLNEVVYGEIIELFVVTRGLYQVSLTYVAWEEALYKVYSPFLYAHFFSD